MKNISYLCIINCWYPNMAGENRLLHMMLKNIINIIKHYYYGLRNW